MNNRRKILKSLASLPFLGTFLGAHAMEKVTLEDEAISMPTNVHNFIFAD